MNVHYNTTTGEIMSYGYGADHGDGFETSHFPGCAVLITDNQPIDARTQRVDPLTLQIVAKDAPDPAPDPVLTVKAAVARALAASDKYALADFPVSGADRAAWLSYRQALRDCSKGNSTADAMLAAIPSQPDGEDGFAWLRSMLASGQSIQGVIFA